MAAEVLRKKFAEMVCVLVTILVKGNKGQFRSSKKKKKKMKQGIK